MKCPRCGLAVRDATPECRGCGFTLTALDRKLGLVPARAAPLDDQAGLVSEPGRAALEARLREFNQRVAGELVVVTRRTTAPLRPAEYAFWLFNHWALGGPEHRGLVLLLALRERRIESEVGYGWEAVAPDVATGAILDERALPLLRSGAHEAALGAAVEALIALLSGGRGDLPEPAKPGPGAT